MKLAIITGASSGMGALFARLAQQQESFDEIWLIARREDRLRECAAALQTKTRILPLDLTKQDSIDTYTALLADLRPKPDVALLINAAGFGKIGSTCSQPLQEMRDMVFLNCLATAQLTLLTLPYMQLGSRVINMASVSGYLPLPYLNTYSATKAFVLHFTQALRNECADTGVHITAVCPYWVDTPFIPVAHDAPAGGAVNRFPFMCRPEPVVRKALKDARRNKMLSLYGFAHVVHILSKITPVRLQMWFWNRMRRK